MPIVGHDDDHLQIAVRRLGCRRLLDKIGLDEGAFDGFWPNRLFQQLRNQG
jgi:hypothetical protein